MSKRYHFIAKYGTTKMLDDEMDRQMADPERKNMNTGEGMAAPKFLKMAFHHNKANLSAKFVNNAYKQGDESMMVNAASHPLLSHENLADAVKYPYHHLQTAAIMHHNVTDDQLKHLTQHGESQYVRQLAAKRLKDSPERRAEDSARWYGIVTHT
jgi:hypothetical protein